MEFWHLEYTQQVDMAKSLIPKGKGHMKAMNSDIILRRLESQ
mgnify:CR=1 FL=1